MEARLSAICEVFGAQAGSAAAILCMVLVAIVLALIVLGFGPLRGWLGLTSPRGTSRSSLPEEGLARTWCLYRELGRMGPQP